MIGHMGPIKYHFRYLLLSKCTYVVILVFIKTLSIDPDRSWSWSGKTIIFTSMVMLPLLLLLLLLIIIIMITSKLPFLILSMISLLLLLQADGWPPKLLKCRPKIKMFREGFGWQGILWLNHDEGDDDDLTSGDSPPLSSERPSPSLPRFWRWKSLSTSFFIIVAIVWVSATLLCLIWIVGTHFHQKHKSNVARKVAR